MTLDAAPQADTGPTFFLAAWAALSTLGAFVVLVRLHIETGRRERAEDQLHRLSRRKRPMSDYVD